DTDHYHALHSDALSAHVTAHFLALEDTARSHVLSDGARNAVENGVTMGIALTTEIQTLAGTGIALTLGVASDLQQSHVLKQLRSDLITRLVVAFLQAEYPDAATSSDISLGKTTRLSLGHAGSTTLTHSYLHSTIAIAFFGFERGDAIRLDLNDRNRNGDTFFGENAGHAALTTDYTNSHVVNLMSVRGFHPLWPPISERYTTKTSRF